MHDQIVLAIDTSSTPATFAIANHHQLLASVSSETAAQHSQTFFGYLQDLLVQAQLTLEQIDVFAAVSGPGSFTGLRVGLSAIKGLAQVYGRPILGVNAFDLIAISIGKSGEFLIVLEAGRNEVFVGKRFVYADAQIQQFASDWVGAPVSLPEGFQREAEEAVILGSGAYRINSGLVRAIACPDSSLAVTLALHAKPLLACGRLSDLHPYYLRPSDAEVKLALLSL